MVHVHIFNCLSLVYVCLVVVTTFWGTDAGVHACLCAIMHDYSVISYLRSVCQTLRVCVGLGQGDFHIHQHWYNDLLWRTLIVPYTFFSVSGLFLKCTVFYFLLESTTIPDTATPTHSPQEATSTAHRTPGNQTEHLTCRIHYIVYKIRSCCIEWISLYTIRSIYITKTQFLADM